MDGRLIQIVVLGRFIIICYALIGSHFKVEAVVPRDDSNQLDQHGKNPRIILPPEFHVNVPPALLSASTTYPLAALDESMESLKSSERTTVSTTSATSAFSALSAQCAQPRRSSLSSGASRLLTRALSFFGIGNRAQEVKDRRSCQRSGSTVSTTCRLVGDPQETTLLAFVRDVSASGVLLHFTTPEDAEKINTFEAGDLLCVEVPGTPASPSPAMVLACIVRIEKREGWLLGCVFATELAPEDLARFTGLFRPPLPDQEEQRVWERFPCLGKATYTRVIEPQPAPSVAEILNISLGGAALRVQEHLQVGDLIGLDLEGPDNSLLAVTLASIVRVTTPTSHSSDDHSGNVVGCNFIQELKEEVLNELLSSCYVHEIAVRV